MPKRKNHPKVVLVFFGARGRIEPPTQGIIDLGRQGASPIQASLGCNYNSRLLEKLCPQDSHSMPKRLEPNQKQSADFSYESPEIN